MSMVSAVSDQIPASIASKLPTKRVRITIEDAERVAELMAKRVTEKGACLILGINPESFRSWVSRAKNHPRFATMVERVRETKFNQIIETIDKAGDERSWVNRKGEQVTASGDWRAKAWIAERIIAPDRCGDKQALPQVNVTQNIQVIQHLSEMVYGAQKQIPCQANEKPAIEHLTPKHIASNTSETNG